MGSWCLCLSVCVSPCVCIEGVGWFGMAGGLVRKLNLTGGGEGGWGVDGMGGDGGGHVRSASCVGQQRANVNQVHFSPSSSPSPSSSSFPTTEQKQA